ncbi:aquaporin-like protein [Pisolithus marmoratus]|nr:aquaporin-like protein [Pisolithus marmoratus]
MTVHEPVVVHLRDVEPRLSYVTSWEYFKHKKVHWLIEMLAEMLGAFIYVYSGLGPTAAYIAGTITSQNGIGSLYTVGFSYAIGVVISITLCAATSGSHINPGLTIALCVFRGFPIAKVARYILAQVFGAYLACLIVYLQWKDLLVAAENVLKAKGTYDTTMFTNVGPAGVFALYQSPTVNLYRVLLNEFMSNFVLGLAICGSRDPTNHFIPPAVAPWIIGFTYAVMIWGYAPTGAPANTARDVGGRLMAITIWGPRASGGSYAAISALTNTPATILAFAVYDFLLGSSTRSTFSVAPFIFSNVLYATLPPAHLPL